jgi:hypothetical protein
MAEEVSKAVSRPHLVTIVVSVGALVVSGASAVLSYEVLALNRQNSIMAQRAYLAVQEPSIGKGTPSATRGKDGKTYEMHFRITNLGNTPASEIAFKASVFTFGRRVLDQHRAGVPDLGPKDSTVYGYSIFVERQQLDFEFLLTARGAVTYRDVFGYQRRSDWCFSQNSSGAIAPCNPQTYSLPEQ